MATPSILIVPDRYKSGVLYSQLPETGAVDFDVTRATPAFRTNASGVLESVASGVPRLDYPAAGGCPSLLIEPAATNLLLRSEEFDDASWTKGRTTTTANTSVAPNGTTTAETLTDDTTASATHRIFSSNVSVVSGTSYATSCFLKAGTSTRAEIILADTLESSIGIIATVFDLSAGTIISGSGRIENYGNGWFRCTNTGTSNTTGNGRVFIYLYNSANQRTYTGTATNTFFLWGAQLETGSVATSYIPTTSATVTRNADVISKTGVSGFIGQTEGTLYAEVDLNQLPASNARTFIDVGSSGNRVFMGFTSLTSNTMRLQIDAGVGGTACVDIRAVVANAGIIKVAVAYQSLNCALYVNGVQATNIQSNIAFSFTTALSALFLGSTISASAFVNDRIRAAAIYTTRLSNTELAALTSL